MMHGQKYIKFSPTWFSKTFRVFSPNLTAEFGVILAFSSAHLH